jgi:ATP-dependent RNA helicase RhlB
MPVQEQVLQHAFGGQDLYVQSQTGTGKTAAFLVVIFQRLLSEVMLNGKKAIIMVPTRELAVQVEEEAKLLGKFLPFKIGSFYGGVGYTQQTKMLRDNVQIMVGTPGRMLDLNHGGQMNLMEIAFLVLDEADRMFDMGFYPDLRKLIRVVPPADRRQTMLFSATLNTWVKNLAWEYTKNPFEIAIEPETVTVEEVEQVLYHVSSADKMKLLLGILKREEPESALIFCNTKRYAEIVAKRLKLNGFECEFIMGDLPQPKRLKIIDDIKAGKLRILVATDVAARGLDIEGLALVVNYDLPNESENYVHRIGRTARAGKTGKAITLASEQDVYELPRIERYIGRKIPSETANGELLAADNSEGKHIHTDFHEERNSGTSRVRHRDHEPRKDHTRGKHREYKAIPVGSESSVKLSALSFEERMAYYKQKYDKSASFRGKNTEQKKPAHNVHKSKSQTGHSEKKRDRAGGRKERREHSVVRNEIPGKVSLKGGNAEAPFSSGTALKKGILSKIFGFFAAKDKGGK